MYQSKSSIKFQILRIFTNFSEKEVAIVQMKKKNIFFNLFEDLLTKKTKDILIRHQLIIFFLRTSYDNEVKSLLNKVAIENIKN